MVADVPYTTSELAVLDQHVTNHNRYSPSDYLVHLGDIKGSSSACVESVYQDVANVLLGLAVPAFVIPGDNEWNDCDDPDEAWDFWETYFTDFEGNFCGTPPVQAQLVRPENFAFVDRGVLFIGINLVGGSVQSSSEWSQRLQQDADWVSQQLSTQQPNVRAAVIFAHAGPGQSKHATFFNQFGPAAASFAKPILYLHGDGHSWLQNRPFTQQNVLRVQLERGTTPPVEATVGLDAQNPFSLDRNPWPSGTPRFNKAPCVETLSDLSLDLGDVASLDALVTDDGDPDPPARVTTAWSQVSGPGPATIASPSAIETTASFPDAGSYVLRLSANDSQLVSSDDLSIEVLGGGPSLTVDDVFVGEGQNAVFTVRLLSADGGSVGVAYATANGSAVSGSDYSARSGTLSFSGTTTSRTISVPVLLDGIAEGTESFVVNLSSPSGASLSKAQGLAVVLDADSTAGPVVASFTPTSGTAGAQVTIAGSGFTGASQVAFNGSSASSFVVDSGSQIRAVVPGGASTGPISVTTPSGTGSSTASFLVRLPLLTVEVTGSGSVALSPPGGSYASGSVVTLTALPGPGFQFASWSGDLSGTANPATIAMNGDRSVTASFTTLPPGFVSLDVVLDGLGSVATIPSGRVHPVGTSVTLTATPAAGHGFAEWSGDLAGTANPATLSLDAHKVVTATFLEVFDLQVSVLGEGSVTVAPPGPSFLAGTGLTLTATPASGFVFHGWRGALSGSTDPATLVMSGDRSVDALFKRPGVGVTHQETKTGSSSGASSVSTSASLAAAAGDLYLAAVSMRPYLNTSAVAGLGLAWSELADQCGGGSETGVSLWWARGSPTSDIVTASFAGSATNAVLAVSRYSGVDPANPIATPPQLVRANTNGTNGGCSGGVETASYSIPFSTAGYGSVVHAAAAIRNRSHTPGAGYTELAELSSGNGSHKGGIAVMRQTRIVPEPVSVAGTLSASAAWAAVAVEVRQQVYFRPTVAGFDPAGGLPGAEVVVSGSSFAGANGVRFGGVPASFTLDSDAQLHASVPAGALSGPIQVTNPAGTGTSTASFLVADACANGADDDGDGLADFPADPGCQGPLSTTESPQCDDGVDNDHDGNIDWDGGASGGPADLSCAGHGWGSRENLTRCGLGFEIALGLPLVAWLRRRRPR